MRAPGSLEEEEAEAEAAQKELRDAQMVQEEGKEVTRLLGLAPDEAQALRAQLDARLQVGVELFSLACKGRAVRMLCMLCWLLLTMSCAELRSGVRACCSSCTR